MKPKREITLGEMQDECKRVFGGCALCRVKNECAFCLDVQPAEVDLTDPPRFTEAQMALLRVLMDMGAEYATQREGMAGFYAGAPTRRVALIDANIFDEGATVHLAELFGDASK